MRILSTRSLVLLMAAGCLLFASRSHALPGRVEVPMDDGTEITVDNFTSLTKESELATLILVADRSTQTDCPFNGPRKGLFKAGDRIFVNDNYLAWFDLTPNDGTGTSDTWDRGGELAGFWTLDRSTKLFRYWTTGPHGCTNWPRNELVPGSASPNGEHFWWDKYAPPVEHSLQVNGKYFMSHHYGKQAAEGKWALVLDGVESAAGVHYKSSTRMASWSDGQGGGLQVDVTDDNDANGIANFIQSELEYICRSNDILVIWKLQPDKADVVSTNLYSYVWAAYSFDQDAPPHGTGPADPKTGCDAGGPNTNDWPGVFYQQPLYTQSSLPLRRNWNPGAGAAPPGTIVEMDLGPQCPPPPHTNQDIFSVSGAPVSDRAWLTWGADPGMSLTRPQMTYTVVGVPGSGAGTQADPTRIPWKALLYANETRDGVLGGSSGISDPFTLRARQWYQGAFELHTVFVQRGGTGGPIGGGGKTIGGGGGGGGGGGTGGGGGGGVSTSVSLFGADTHVTESVGQVKVQVRVTTSDGQPTKAPVSATYATQNGTAAAGSDYTAVAGSVSFPSGTADGTTSPISIPILKDAAVEQREYFELHLTGANGASVGTQYPIHYVNIDDDPLPANDAAFVSVEAPGTMVTGQQYQVAVTVRNTGANTWTSATRHALGAQSPSLPPYTWGVGRVGLPSNVAPGGTVRFLFYVTAPMAPGEYDFRWMMIQEAVDWFGSMTPPMKIRVSEPAQPVEWRRAVNVAVSGNGLTRTGVAGWNAGASSTKQLIGNGYVEFTAGPAGSHRILGLGNGDTGQSYSDVTFGFLLADTGVLTIYESGNFRGYFGTYSPTDRLRISVESGAVRYYRNGVLLHTSASSPTFPLLVDSSLYETGAPLNDVTLSGPWQ